MLDDSLLQEFIAESREHLSAIEPDLLELEKNAVTTAENTINSIFRAIHSIKGASGFFGFENLKQFSHVMESVLMLIRDKTLVPTTDIVDVLLRSVDRLTEMVEDIQHSDTVDVLSEKMALEAILTGTFAGEPVAAESKGGDGTCLPEPSGNAAVCPFNMAAPEVVQAKASGQFIYVLTIFPQVDFAESVSNASAIALLENLASVGQLLAACTDQGKT